MARLLVVDDDEQMLCSLLDVLDKAGHDVAGAASGHDALALAQTQGPAIELVVSDVRMAGMDGIECIERLSDGRPELKSIIITGYASDDVPVRAMDLESCDYLFKPFTADQLIASVSRALARPEPSSVVYPTEMQEVMARMAGLQAARYRAFQNYFLGVRSAHLGAAAALTIWDELEAAELQHKTLEKQLELRFGAEDLQRQFEQVTQHCKTPAAVAGQKRLPGGVTRVQFQGLFNKIRDGSLSCEQLRAAIYSRHDAKQAHDPIAQAVAEAYYASIWT